MSRCNNSYYCTSLFRLKQLTLLLASVLIFSLEGMEREYEQEREISVLYYPTQKLCLPFGHVKLEIGGTVYNIDESYFIRSKTEVPKDQCKEYGFPYVRYSITVTPEEFEVLQKDIVSRPSIHAGGNCAYNVCEKLLACANYHIRQPLSYLPLTTALYLTSARLCGSQRVTKMQLYGSRNGIKNVIKGFPGVAFELCVIAVVVYALQHCLMRL